MFSATHRNPKARRGGTGSDARRRPLAAVLAVAGTTLLVAVVAAVPYVNPVTAAAARAAAATADQQTVQVDVVTAGAIAPRDGYAAELSPARTAQQLVGKGTQYDWARLVLYFGGWDASDGKVLAIAQWMRAENAPQSWWNRDNPLNNGWGTLAGNFMSGYSDLVSAAQQCADAIRTNGGYQVIEDALSKDSTRDQVRAAIIASSWATGHYGGGAHWGGGRPPAVSAPASAWGR